MFYWQFAKYHPSVTTSTKIVIQRFEKTLHSYTRVKIVFRVSYCLHKQQSITVYQKKTIIKTSLNVYLVPVYLLISTYKALENSGVSVWEIKQWFQIYVNL